MSGRFSLFLLRALEKRETEVDVVLHSLSVRLLCIRMLLCCLSRLSLSFIFLRSLSLWAKGSLTEVERLLLLLFPPREGRGQSEGMGGA